MPPTFFLVGGLILLGLIGPVIAAGLLVAALMPSRRAAALRLLRTGGIGAVAALVVDLVLRQFADPRVAPIRPEEIVVAAGIGFTLGVIARAVRSLAARPAPEPPRLEVRTDGFTLWYGGKALATLGWEQIDRIATYKRDNYVTDEIMLGFEYAGADGRTMHLEVSEEWAGFQDLFGVLEERFPGLSPEWYMRVMQPAFESNYTVLYERSSADPDPATR